MPTMTIPACQASNGSKSTLDAGIESAIAKGGARRGWSDYDRIRETLTLVYEQVTPSEVAIVRDEYSTNRVTGGMLVSVPWVAQDWARDVNGAVAIGSTNAAGYPASYAILGLQSPDASRSIYGWSSTGLPGNLEVDFVASKPITEIVVITLRDDLTLTSVPTTNETFTVRGLTSYTVEYWTGAAWAVVSGGTVTGNNKVMRRFPVTITTSKIRVNATASADGVAHIISLQGNGAYYTADYVAEPDIVPLPGSVNSRVTLRLRT